MSNRQQLDNLLNRWEESREQGQDVSAEEICRDTPHLLAEFQAMVDELRPIDRFMTEKSKDDGPEGLMPAGRYRPLRLHAHGGLGEVFVAQDEELSREVALKRIRATGTDDAIRRFQFEAEITGRLDHPGVVPVYGLGHDPLGRLYYAMRFIRGESLQKAIEGFHRSYPTHLAAGPADTDFKELIRRFVVVCQTVAYAHSQSIIHRDLKPANIMLGRYGETVVIDWGLAKQVERKVTADADTVVFMSGTTNLGGEASILGEVKGSPSYMSPEQAEGRPIGDSSDIYSLGATLYTILTGHMPFEGQEPRVLLDRVKRGDFVRPRQLRGDVPRALEAVCLKAMAREPRDRYATALDLAADLKLWGDGNPVTAWREPWPDRARRWMRKRRALTSSVVASLVVALLGISAVAVQQNLYIQRLRTAEAEKTAAHDETKQTRKENRELEDTALSEFTYAASQNPNAIILLGQPSAAITKAFVHEIDRFGDKLPHNEAGERAGVGIITQLVDEATRRSQAGDGPGARAAIEKGLAFCEKYGRPGARFGKVVACQAAVLVTVAAKVPSSTNSTSDWEKIVNDADRALVLIKNNESAEFVTGLDTVISGISGGLWVLGWRNSDGAATRANEEAVQKKTMESYRDCWHPAVALAIRANYLYLLHRYAAARASAEESLQISGRCSPALDHHRDILLVKAIAEHVLGLGHLQKKEFPYAWEFLSQALEHAKEAEASLPPDADRGPLNKIQLSIAEAGAGYLNSPEARSLKPNEFRAIQEKSLRAIGDYLAEPAPRQDAADTARMKSLQEELVKRGNVPTK